jgi:hypothetical protein
VGTAADYTLGQSPTDLPRGTGIFLNDGGNPELIGIVANTDLAALNLSDGGQFIFV